MVKIAVKLEKKNKKARYGHMAFHYENKGKTEFRGFYPNRSKIPEKILNDDTLLRQYLIDHSLEGQIKRDILMKNRLKDKPELFMTREDEVDPSKIEEVKEDTKTGERLKYSFSPDKHKCHNCVTWARFIYNKYSINDQIPEIKNGRIKYAMEVLEECVK